MWRDRLLGDGVDTDDRSCHTERINVASVACNNRLKNYKCFGFLLHSLLSALLLLLFGMAPSAGTILYTRNCSDIEWYSFQYEP